MAATCAREAFTTGADLQRPTRMDLSLRTALRGFLLAGGIVFVLLGVVEGSTFNIALGGVAAFLGAVGLWTEWQGRGME